jgi:4-hydroxy-4-methyl-2-oxoglutarate aldolase
VIDGSVRDLNALTGRGFAVYATGVAAAGTTKHLGGEVGLSVSVGGVEVSAGDCVVGDPDGVAVLAARDWEALLGRAEAKAVWEADAIVQIRSGVTTIDLFELDVDRVQLARTTAVD